MKKKEDFEKCEVCDVDLFLKEIEIYGQLYPIGVYCNNEKCARYLFLLV